MKKSFTYTSLVPQAIGLSPDGSKAVVGAGESILALDADTGKIVHRHAVEGNTRFAYQPTNIVFTQDGNTAAVLDNNTWGNLRRLHLLEMSTGKVRPLTPRASESGLEQEHWAGLAFAPDGKKLWIAYKDCIVKVDVATGELPAFRKPEPDWNDWRNASKRNKTFEFQRRGIQPDDLTSLNAFAVSADGRIAALCGRFRDDDCGLRIVDTGTGVTKYPGKIEILKPPFSTKPPFLKSANEFVWDAFRQTELSGGRKAVLDVLHGRLSLNGFKAEVPANVRSFITTTDGETLIVTGNANQFPPKPLPSRTHVYDVLTSKEWAIPIVPPGEEFADHRNMTISADGRVLAALKLDGSLWLWEIATWKPRLRLEATGRDIYRHTFSPDGRYMMSHNSAVTRGALWDLHTIAEPAKLTDKDCDSLWADLASDDAVKAFRAIVRFAHDPEHAAPYLKEKAAKLPTLTDETRLAARPFDPEIVLARRIVEALERSGTPAAVAALKELEKQLPYAAPQAAAARIEAK